MYIVLLYSSCLLVGILIEPGTCSCKQSYVTICDSVQDLLYEPRSTQSEWIDLLIQPDRYEDVAPEYILKPEHVKFLENLKRLVIIRQLNRIQNSFAGGFSKLLNKVDTVILYDNNMQTIDSLTFQMLVPQLLDYQPKLERLSLQNNNLENIKRHAFIDFQAHDIDLSYNQLKTLVRDTFIRGSVTQLDTRHNELSTIESDALPHDLKILRLDYNNFHLLPVRAINSLSQLQKLTLSHNQLSYVGNLSTLQLQELDLSFNNIFVIDNIIDRMRRLYKLNLEHNNVVEFSFPSYNKLLTLSLAYNRLRTLNVSSRNMPDLISLRGNPWNCRCFDMIEKHVVRHSYWYKRSCDYKTITSGNIPVCLQSSFYHEECPGSEDQISEDDFEFFKKFVKNITC